MRHSRFTFVGAYHHIMNRGDKGENIFGEEELIMSNHFHLIVQNSSGKISQMMRALDGQNY